MHPRGVLKHIIAVFVFLDMPWYKSTKKGGRIICCAQVLRDFWVDLLSLHDVNKTYLNTAAFACLGQESFFTKTAERHLGSGAASKYEFYFRINSRQLFYFFPFLVQPYATQVVCFVISEQIIVIWSFSVYITASSTCSTTAFRGRYTARVNHNSLHR